MKQKCIIIITIVIVITRIEKTIRRLITGMKRNRLWNGIIISALAVTLGAVPAMATEAENTESISVDSELQDMTEDTWAGEASFSSDMVEVEGTSEDSSETDNSVAIGSEPDEVVTYSVVEDSASGDGQDAETDEDNNADYGIETYATEKASDTSVTDGFGQDPESGDWYYYTDGQIDTGKNSVIKGTVNETTGWWYVVEGKVQLDFTGLANYANANGWWYIRDGMVDFTVNTVAKNKNGWWYVEDGKVDFGYTGFAQNDNGLWYCEDGKVTFKKQGILKDSEGGIGSTSDWYYVIESKVQTDFTGLGNFSNANGWWYITNGKVDFTQNTVAKNKNGWWYVEGGKVDFSYNGFGENINGKWYCESGKVTFNKNSVIKDTTGVIGTKGDWYYVVGSKVQTDFTGLANYSNSNGWWYIQDGIVDFSANTVAKNNNGWWYIEGGKVDFSYNGFGENINGKWYCENGKVTFNKNSVIKDETGAIGTKGDWWYVVGSEVQEDFTGLANYKNGNGWWYIRDGKVDFTVNTVAKNNNGWWYVDGGKVIFSYNGIAKNSNGWWYIKDGKVDFSYNGTVTVAGGTYNVSGGKVQDVDLEDGVVSSELVVSDASNYIMNTNYINYSGTGSLEAPQFSGTVNSSGTMTLSWNAVKGAEKYCVFRKTYGGSWSKIATTTSTTYTDSKYTDSAAYYYTVRCVSSDGSTYTSPYIESFSGSAVAEYGQQFIGNPYVYGGTSLTNGCDCSGFVMQVYAHFGVLLPHYSGSQIQCGKYIGGSSNLSLAQPGDIVGRTGHVMIYIGNGQVVHARGAQYGICITAISSSNFSTIRRIF